MPPLFLGRITLCVPAPVQSAGTEVVVASLSYSRIYPRYHLHYPIIFGGAPFVGEGVLTNLSFSGCSVLCGREVQCGSQVRVSVLVPDQAQALTIELGTIKWVQGHQFGVEFVCLPEETRQRLNSRLRTELIHLLKTPSGQNELLVLPVQKHQVPVPASPIALQASSMSF